jgi:hypothetical protein
MISITHKNYIIIDAKKILPRQLCRCAEKINKTATIIELKESFGNQEQKLVKPRRI